MGCGGGCPKKTLRLKSEPQGISREMLQSIRSYIDFSVRIKDRIGITTQGKCIDVWVDESQQGEYIDLGNVAVETHVGINMIGLDMIEEISLIPQ